MSIYVVPDTEQYRFAKTLKYSIVDTPESNMAEATFICEELTLDILEDVVRHGRMWHGRRNVVCSDIAYDIKKDQYTDLRELDYLIFWTKKYRISIHPATLRKIHSQAEFVGYDTFFQMILNAFYLNKSGRDISSMSTIWNLYSSVPTGNPATITAIAEDCIHLYGESVVFGSLVTLFDKVLQYMEAPESLVASGGYKKLISEIAEKTSPVGIMTSLHYLSSQHLPTGLKLIMAIEKLCAWKSLSPDPEDIIEDE